MLLELPVNMDTANKPSYDAVHYMLGGGKDKELWGCMAGASNPGLVEEGRLPGGSGV